MNNLKLYVFILSIIVPALITSCSTNSDTTVNGPLVIQEQGSFAVGGTVISNPGTFDPYKPTPEGTRYKTGGSSGPIIQ